MLFPVCMHIWSLLLLTPWSFKNLLENSLKSPWIFTTFWMGTLLLHINNTIMLFCTDKHHRGYGSAWWRRGKEHGSAFARRVDRRTVTGSRNYHLHQRAQNQNQRTWRCKFKENVVSLSFFLPVCLSLEKKNR